MGSYTSTSSARTDQTKTLELKNNILTRNLINYPIRSCWACRSIRTHLYYWI